jgi:hypothetical protein
MTRYFLLLAVFLPLSHGFAADPSYIERVKSAESAIGDQALFQTIDNMTPDQRRVLLEEKGGQLQWLGTARSLAGDAPGAGQAFGWFNRLRPPRQVDASSLAALQAATSEDAIEAIARLAGNRQIVILNEAHHVPLHRVFAAQLAHRLRSLGFTYLACETFDEKIPHPLANGYVDAKAGFYSKEPAFGEFLRSAIRDQWTMVSYDHMATDGVPPEDSLRARESGSLANLIERIFRRDPKARVFIYVGYGHAKEKPAYIDETTFTPLAALLGHALHTDPLTIDQATMVGYADRRAEHPLYRPALARFHPMAPFVLKSKDGGYEVLGDYRNAIDVQVIHPDDNGIAATGRPEWMEKQAHLRATPVPAQFIPAQGRRLVKAFHAEDPADAVPADIVTAEAGKLVPAFMLPAGQFRFEYED